jgi:hypothetical protein
MSGATAPIIEKGDEGVKRTQQYCHRRDGIA